MNSFKSYFNFLFNRNHICIIISSNSKPPNFITSIINFSKSLKGYKNIAITFKTTTRHKLVNSDNLEINIVNSYVLSNWIFIFIKEFSLCSFTYYTYFSPISNIIIIYKTSTCINLFSRNFC